MAEQIRWRRRVAAAVMGCAAAAAAQAAMAQVTLAANDPRALDLREDDGGRPPSLILGPDAAAPLPAAGAPLLRGNPLWGIPVQSLQATRERPLFSPSRRPPVPAAIAPAVEPVKAVAPPPEPEQPALNLLGVVTGSGDAGTADAIAVFVNTTTHDVFRLHTGEGHDGWILQSVSSREVVLEKNHRTAVVALPAAAGAQK